MKKLILTVLSALLVLSLCACQSGEKETTANTTESVAQTTEATTEATTAVTTQPGEDLKALAESCMEKSVDELYALIGEPESSDYAPSCLGEGEDGMLYYDGFVVYTYREGDEETVEYVE